MKLNNLIWLLSDKILKLAVGVGVSVAMARSLGPEMFGQINYVIAVAFIVMSSASLGLQGILVREFVIAEDKQQIADCLGSSLISRLVWGLTLCALTFIYAWHANSEVSVLVAVLCLGMAFNGFEVFDFYFQSREQSKKGAKIRLLTMLICSLLKVGSLIFYRDVGLLISIYAIEYVLTAVCYLYVYKRGFNIGEIGVRFSVVKALLHKSWPLILSGIGMMVYVKTDQIMIKHYLDERNVGLYAVAAQLSEVWWFIPNAIVTVLFPGLIIADEKSEGSKWQGVMDLLFLSGLLTCVVVFSVAWIFVPLLYGPQYLEVIPVLNIYIWATIFIFLRAGVSKWIITKEMYLFSMVSHFSGAIINVVLNSILIPAMGIKGAAIATVISYFVSGVGFLYLFKATRCVGLYQLKAVVNFPKALVFWFQIYKKRFSGGKKYEG